jgi:hypothetical protein
MKKKSTRKLVKATKKKKVVKKPEPKEPKILVKWIRDKHRTPIGCVVATGPHKVGWSLWNRKSGDKYDKGRGKDIAIGRAEQFDVNTFYKIIGLLEEVKDSYSPANLTPDEKDKQLLKLSKNTVYKIAHTVRKDFWNMLNLTERYYKDSEK